MPSACFDGRAAPPVQPRARSAGVRPAPRPAQPRPPSSLPRALARARAARRARPHSPRDGAPRHLSRPWAGQGGRIPAHQMLPARAPRALSSPRVRRCALRLPSQGSGGLRWTGGVCSYSSSAALLPPHGLSRVSRAPRAGPPGEGGNGEVARRSKAGLPGHEKDAGTRTSSRHQCVTNGGGGGLMGRRRDAARRP